MHGNPDHHCAPAHTPLPGTRNANRHLGHVALALLAFAIFAFSLKAVASPEVQARYTPVVIVHAGAMIAWLALFASQAYLAASGRLALHRRLGKASLALVLLMSVTGAMISVNIGLELGRPEVTIVNLAAFAVFVPLYLAALRFAARRRVHEHRLAMLIATLALMTPAYARVVQVLGLWDPIAIALDISLTGLVAAGYDLAITRRLTRPLIWMLAFGYAVRAAMIAVLAVWFL
ncbi:MAG: hypothetical protein V2I27_00715 [Erythrobacter sp.]|jgi:uncharacterized membrane protein YozB (DUF420 family)|nr:hypothetical protein [Erythrobacter sp.]